MNKKRPRRVPLIALTAALALPLMLGACGSGGSSSSDAPAAQGDSTSSAQTGEVQFSECMRTHGVTNMPDPQDGHFVMGPGVQSNPNWNSAVQACQHYLGPGGLGGGSGSQQNEQAELAFAQCMQSHGENVPDPQGGALNMGGVNRNSPTFKNAYNACKSKLPGGGSGGAAG